MSTTEAAEFQEEFVGGWGALLWNIVNLASILIYFTY